MQTTIIGFPRIGKKRELKFLTEKFFRREIDENCFLKEVELINKNNIEIMKGHLDLIPVNDFSLYDNTLDMMWALGVVEKHYIENALSNLEKYFAIARGVKTAKFDLKPYDMKKWFNTNYHFIVPKLNDNLFLKTNFFFIENNIKIAKELIKNFKVILIGPYTFFKLAKKEKYSKKVIDVIMMNYKELLKKIAELNVEVVQIDEPAMCFDADKKDIDLFKRIYSEILKNKFGLKLFLQTYFSYVDDSFISAINEMNIDGIGLDFVEGKENLKLIKKIDLKNKFLIAGIINGKNIWINSYKDSIEIINYISKFVKKDNIILSTSCSLLFVPYTKMIEDNINKEKLKFLSFAIEKLQELKEIKYLLNTSQYTKEKLYIKNTQTVNLLKKISNSYANKKVVSKIKILKLNRKSNIVIRRKKQDKFLKLPLLPTTTIGSFPQTEDIRRIRKEFKVGKITKEKYEQFIKEKIRDLIKFQEKIKIDVLVHGEFERNDMVEYFAENLNGFIITKNGWVQSYGTRATKPAIIFSYVKRTKPITVDYIKYAQNLTEKPVKAILTGPITIINWSFPNEFLKLKNIAFSIADALKEEIDELVKNKIKIIQVDEAALRERLPLKKHKQEEYLNTAVNAFRFCVKDVPDEIQVHTHMCYSEFKDIVKYIEKMDVDVISIEASRSGFEILKFLKKYAKKRQIGPGVYDIHSPRIPTVEEIKEKIQMLLKFVPKKNLWINPDCGLKTRNWEEVKPSLANMVKAKENII